MADVAFPITTAPGARPGEGAGRLINAYAEQLQGGARATYARRRAPGLRRIATTTEVGCRGLHYHNGTLYVAMAETLYKVTLSGSTYTVTELGELTGTQRVTFARNNKAPVPDIICTTEDDTYTVDSASAPASLGDGDLPAAATVDFLDGYFIWAIRDGRYFVSGINDTTVNALDFGKAESRPGGIYTAKAFGEQLLLMGPNSIEVWQNAGNATGTPFSRVSVIPRGLASAFAVAGNEDGFNVLAFVGDDNAVYILTGGYTPQRISSPDLERLLQAVDDKTEVDVSVAVTSGHMWVFVSGPTFTWCYEVNSGLWHERKSFNGSRFRAICSVRAFNDKWVMGDRETGDLWILDDSYAREGTDPLVMTVISAASNDFPNRAAINRVDFEAIVGQGLVAGEQPIETDPVCLISWSDDGGATFGNPVMRKLGPVAAHKTIISVNRTGTVTPYGRAWKIEVSDPVYVSWLRGVMNPDQRSR